MTGKFPGILVCADTYNLFGNNIHRGNAKRKEKSWLKGLPFYKFKQLVTNEDGTVSYKWVQRLTMEYAAGFNQLHNINTADERDPNNSPEAELSGDGRTEESVGSNDE